MKNSLIDNTEGILEFTKKFFDLIFIKDNFYSFIGNKYKVNDIQMLLNPKSKDKKELVSCMELLPYEIRIAIGREYLSRLINENFKISFNYYLDKKDISYGNDKILESLLNKDGYTCWKSIKEQHVVNGNITVKYEEKTEYFYQLLVDRLYYIWTKQLELVDENNTVEKNAEYIFERQLTGRWLYYNPFKQNFLKIYLEFLKNKGHKINIFVCFNKKLDEILHKIIKGKLHYSKDELFNVMFLIFDFYSAVLDMYGENNTKVIQKLQKKLNEIFTKNIETEKLGFMNSFLYTKKIIDRVSKKSKIHESDSIVYLFWNEFYNDNTPSIMRKIFITALINSWNESSLSKVRNSIELLVKLSTFNFYKETFYYYNQNTFYKDIIANASDLKKSVKSILFSKAMTSSEGGLF